VRDARSAGAWPLWWLGCFGVWTLAVGSWDIGTVIAGVVTAAVAATVAESARLAARVHPRPPLERLRRAVSVPAIVLADFGILTYALLASIVRRRAVRGRYLARGFDAGPATARGSAHRAWTVLLAGYSPNAYVVDIDADAGTVLVHDLVPWRRSEEPA
jgi:multisubunit Na+/H+ antiporter MnhE subunit